MTRKKYQKEFHYDFAKFSIPKGSGFPIEKPSTFHLKLLAIGGGHITIALDFLVLVQRINHSANLIKSEVQ
jgi:hypothetical protein